MFNNLICPMDLPDEEDEQVLMPEIHAEMCHETGSLDKNVGGDNEAVDNEDQQDEVQRAIDEQVLTSQKKLDKGKVTLTLKQLMKWDSIGLVGAEAQEQGEPNQNKQNPASQDEGFATSLRMFDMGISDIVKEHEQDMDILMRRIKAKGNDLKDPFHLVDKTKSLVKSLLQWSNLKNVLHTTRWQMDLVCGMKGLKKMRRAKEYALSEGECILQDHYEGWKLGCRKIIALDGCFLKKPNSREILTAVGRDGNNQIYLVAWVIVNVRKLRGLVLVVGFLSLHGEDLKFSDGSGLTLMSDEHKGLIEAVKQAASKASYPQLFTKIMEKIKKANPKAHEYLSRKDPKSWSRAFFREGINCEAVENGFSECFNAVLVSLRHKPIITMLESMRVLVMERMHTMRLIMEKWRGEIWKNGGVKFALKFKQFWSILKINKASNSKFKARKGYDAFTVDEPANTCSCRMWQIS
ncbi:hypothetical protein Tco_1159087, partial [Tanacetum coccineum]